MSDSGKIIEILKQSKRFLVTTHLRPDGDAIGSVSGLCRTLIARGAQVTLTLVSPVTPQFEVFTKDIPYQAVDQLNKTQFDVLFVLDSGDFARTGIEEQLRVLHLPTVNIDHHSTNPLYGDMNWVDPVASSTAEIIADIITRTGLPLDAHIAESLYFGIYTDTRSFQNNSVTSKTFQIMALLLQTGLDPSTILSIVVQNKTLTDVNTLGIGLSNAKSIEKGRIIYTTVRWKELQRINASARHCWSAGLYSQLNNIKDAVVAVSFVEDESAVIFCEFRAKYGYDVRQVALAYGGGGHKAAAGCSRTGEFEEVVQEVLEFLIKDVANWRRTVASGTEPSPEA